MVHRLCHGTALPKPQWTIGCSVELKLFRHTKRDRDFFIELWDIGGSHKYRLTRHVFFSQLNGILLVFDVNNRNSYRNLRSWIKEIVETNENRHPVEDSSKTPPSRPPSSLGSSRHMTGHRRTPMWPSKRHLSDAIVPEDDLKSVVTIPSAPSPPLSLAGPASRGSVGNRHASPLRDLPILIVGNKFDNTSDNKSKPIDVSSEFNSLRDIGIDGCFVSAHHWTNSAELDRFFARVIERRHYGSEFSRHESSTPMSAHNVPSDLSARQGFTHSYTHTHSHSHTHTTTTHFVSPSDMSTLSTSASVGVSGGPSGVRSSFRMARPRPHVPLTRFDHGDKGHRND